MGVFKNSLYFSGYFSQTMLCWTYRFLRKKVYAMGITNLTKDNFEAEVLKSDKPVLVDFWATWCPPCRRLAPVVAKLAEERADTLKVGKVDVDDQQELAAEFQIMSIPTLILFKDGKAVKQTMGFQPEEALVQFVTE